MTRTTRTFGAYLSRVVPARSAARYVHQLQKNATILGSNCAGAAAVSVVVSGIRQHPPDLVVNLLVLEQVLPRRARGTDRHTRAAALAEHLVHPRHALLFVVGDGAVGAHRHAALAAGAVFFDDVSGLRLQLDV